MPGCQGNAREGPKEEADDGDNPLFFSRFKDGYGFVLWEGKENGGRNRERGRTKERRTDGGEGVEDDAGGDPDHTSNCEQLRTTVLLQT